MNQGFVGKHPLQNIENEMDRTDKLEGRVFTTQEDSSEGFIKWWALLVQLFIHGFYIAREEKKELMYKAKVVGVHS